MRSNTAFVLRHGISQLVAMVSTERQEAAQAVQAMLFAVIGEPSRAGQPKPGRKSMGVTVTVGEYGYVVYEHAHEACEALGITPNTLSVRLSQSNGRYVLNRQDPETHNPMSVVVERGKLAETTEQARKILEATPSRNKKPKEEKLEPLEYGERGKIVTNRMKKQSPVINS